MNEAYQKELKRQQSTKLRLGDLLVAVLTVAALAITTFIR